MHYLHLTVRGRVQGVGYRHFIRVEAARLGLCGAVRNLPGGDVEIDAEGDPETLRRLLDTARRGPRHAEVTDVTSEWGEGPPRFTQFEVAYGSIVDD